MSNTEKREKMICMERRAGEICMEGDLRAKRKHVQPQDLPGNCRIRKNGLRPTRRRGVKRKKAEK